MSDRLRKARLVARRRRHHNGHGAAAWKVGLATLLLAVFLIPLFFLTAATAVAAAGGYLLYRDLQDNLKTLQTLEGRESFQTTKIFDRNGELLFEVFGPGKRRYVPLEQIPEELVQATVAAEDETFWTNPGFEPRAVLRAAYQNLRTGEIVSGGSTITQQLVRRVALDPEEALQRTYRRKLKEIALAFIMTRSMPKEQILELYLNEIYYGNLAYGAQAASEVYFGKHVEELSVAEATLLAGLPQSPRRNDPLKNLEVAKAQQWYVLSRMAQEGFISQAEAERAHRARLRFKEKEDLPLKAGHFVDYVRQRLEEEFGEDLVARGGFDVYTTLDLQLNDQVQGIAREHIQAIEERHNARNAAVVVLRPGTGEILAMVGSVDYFDKTIDGEVNVTVRERQPGSSIKPITYLAALEGGYNPAHVLMDQPTRIRLENGETYEPVNYDRRFHGPVRIRTALANSYNVPAVKMLKELGVEVFLEMAHRLGIKGLNRGPQWYGLSITLGGGEVTLLDLSTAFATVGNMGRLVEPTPILRIERNGKVIADYSRPTPNSQVVDPRLTYILADILSDTRARIPAFGASSPLSALPFRVGAKTGTTNDFRDNWTMGFSPNVVVGVWVGNSNNEAMVDTTGVTGAAPIWHDVMLLMHQEPWWSLIAGPEWYERPEGIQERRVCDPHGGCWVELFPAENATVMDMEEMYTLIEVVALPEGGYCWPPEDLSGVPEGWLTQVRVLKMDPDSDQAPDRDRLQPHPEAEVPLPTEDCDLELLQQAKAAEEAEEGEGEAGQAEVLGVSSGLAAEIASPAPGSVLSSGVWVTGTANWGPGQVQFWKVEYRSEGGDWLTIGSTHAEPVEGGGLEFFNAEVLPDGRYHLRLVLVKPDGNWVTSQVVGVTVGPPPSGEDQASQEASSDADEGEGEVQPGG